jgi:hypothetical protein
MQAEIDINYKGLSFSVCGEYDYDAHEFARNIQVLHCGIDMSPIIDSLIFDEIIQRADMGYWDYLKEKSDARNAER